jgi:hypothetical protein
MRGSLCPGPEPCQPRESPVNMSAKVALAVLATAAFVGVSGGAKASIIYSVNVSDGTESVNGTITTDGNTGALSSSDFTAWDLTVAGTSPLPDPFVITSADVGAEIFCQGGGCGDATLSELFWPFPNSIDFVDLVGPTITGGVYFSSYDVELTGLGCGNGVCYVFDAPTMPQAQVAISPVPEPSSLSVLAAGLFALGLYRHRRKGIDAAAVG